MNLNKEVALNLSFKTFNLLFFRQRKGYEQIEKEETAGDPGIPLQDNIKVFRTPRDIFTMSTATPPTPLYLVLLSVLWIAAAGQQTGEHSISWKEIFLLQSCSLAKHQSKKVKHYGLESDKHETKEHEFFLKIVLGR